MLFWCLNHLQKMGWSVFDTQSSANSIWKDRVCSCGFVLTHDWESTAVRMLLSFDSTRINQPYWILAPPWSKCSMFASPCLAWLLRSLAVVVLAEDASGNNFSLPSDTLLGYAIPGNLEHMWLVNTGQTLAGFLMLHWRVVEEGCDHFEGPQVL